MPIVEVRLFTTTYIGATRYHVTQQILPVVYINKPCMPIVEVRLFTTTFGATRYHVTQQILTSCLHKQALYAY
jgi:hypothetical protein